MAYSRILVPVDGSKHAVYACRVAADLADAIPGEETIHLAYCVETIPDRIGGKQREELEARYEREAAEIFAPCLEIFRKTGNPCFTHLLFGDPGPTLARAAKNYDCQLIVMGTHGTGNLAGLVIGSVSHEVMQHADVPVLLANIGKARVS